MKFEKIGKCLLNVLGYMGLLYLERVIHELGHAITALLLGAEVLEFHIFPQPYCVIRMKDIETYRVILMAGAPAAILYGLSLMKIGKKKELIIPYTVGLTVVSFETAYWGISPFIKRGDAHRLYNTFKDIDPKPISYCFIVGDLLFVASSLRTVDKIIKSKFLLE